jgi:hypothetical protein
MKWIPTMVAKDCLDPKGCWEDPSGYIRRMSGEQEIIATVTGECSEAEWNALCRAMDNATREHAKK